MSQERETFDETEAPIPLRTHGDVQRALAKVLRQIRKSSIDLPMAHALIIGFGTLAKMMREGVSDDLADRMDRLEAKQSAGAEAAPH